MDWPLTVGQALAVLVALAVVRILRLVYVFFLRPGRQLRKYGEWAIVTGATDGIGYAYAFELAAQGLSILLIARSEEKLVQTAKALREKFPGVQTEYIKVDFSHFDAAAKAAVRAKVQALDIGILINNVGVSYPFTKYFHELKDQEVADILEVNVSSAVWMTRIVLGDVDAESNPISGMLMRRRGAIVNTSSGGARVTSPLLAEYSGAKSFIEMFSRGLNAELASKGIHVQVQTPLFVTTKMAKIRQASLTVPSPESYVKCAVRQIGYGAAISPHWTHSLQLWFLSLLPEPVLVYIIDMQHQAIRRKGMTKEKQKKDEVKKDR